MPLRLHVRYGTVATVLGLLLLQVGGAWAQQPLGPVQFFSRVEQAVVGQGQPFELQVSLYASPAGEASVAALKAAFEAADLTAYPEGLEVLRRSPVGAVSQITEWGVPVEVLTRTITLRLMTVGAHVVPGLSFDVGAQHFESPPHAVEVYQLGPDFFDASAAVVPVVAEVPIPGRHRRIRRNGSAFLVAPDVLVTSYHVILDARRVRVTLPNGERTVLREAWVLDPARDIALLYIDPQVAAEGGLRPLALAPFEGSLAPLAEAAQREADNDAVVFTYGWPGGVQRSSAALRYPHTTLDANAQLWVSANPVRPGDSGGPLLDRQGRVLGVVSSGTVRGASRDVLREELCIATDLRPALGAQLRADLRRPLRRLQRDPAVRHQPHVLALQLSALINLQGRSIVTLQNQFDDFNEMLDRTQIQDPGLFFMRGVVHQVMGTSEEAAEAYRATLAVFDDHFPAAYMLGRYHLMRREYPAAEAFFGQAAAPPYVHLVAYGMAQTHMGQRQYEAAIQQFEAVLRFDPAFAPALHGMGLAYLALGDTVRAQQLHVRLNGVSRRWASQLRQAIRYPVLRPPVLRPLPRAPFPTVPLH